MTLQNLSIQTLLRQGGTGWLTSRSQPPLALRYPHRDPQSLSNARMRPLPSTCTSLAPRDRLAPPQGPQKAGETRVGRAVSASSLLVSRPQPGRTLTDSQQGHIDEEVPYGGDHILAHLPFHLLRVQLRRKALDPEHRSSSSRLPAAALCSSQLPPSAGTRPNPISCSRPSFSRVATGACEGQTSSLNWAVLNEGGLKGVRVILATKDSGSSRLFFQVVYLTTSVLRGALGAAKCFYASEGAVHIGITINNNS